MRIVVVGGKLQGTEAAYLARQAGWEVVLVDKDRSAPATGLCDKFYHLNVGEAGGKITDIFKRADLIVPAVEDEAVLEQLGKAAGRAGVPMAYDTSAYNISSSKQKSDRLFEDSGIPAPSHWPKCSLPVIVKPSGSSGSQGVRKVDNSEELLKFLQQCSGSLESWVIQEYLDGPSYSLEVVGCGGKYLTLQTTDLDMDCMFDCKRVSAPTGLEKPLENQFRELAVRIAKAVNLTGIMDVEVIKHENILKVLEIDARLPSQTPTAVFKSTGVNMITLLSDVYLGGSLTAPPDPARERAVIYEHVSVSGSGLETLGEHIMASAGPLKHLKDFFGADEALTNFEAGRGSWVATLIITGSSCSEVRARRSDVMANIRKYCDLPDGQMVID